MKFPFRAKIIDLRFPNCDYPVTIKNQRDFDLLMDLNKSQNFRVEYKLQEQIYEQEFVTA